MGECYRKTPNLGEVDDGLILPTTKKAIYIININIPSDEYLYRLDLNKYA